MTAEAHVRKVHHNWTMPGVHVTRLGRMIDRFCAVLLWTLACYVLVRIASLPIVRRRPAARKFGGTIGRAWIKVMPTLLGLRIQTNGQPPQSPFFLVNNHISWLDFLAMNMLLKCRCVVMAEMRDIPIAGRIIHALDPIYVRRVREDTPRVLHEMIYSLRENVSLMMCPEGRITPGQRVLRFHASLLESAVQTRRPVNWACLTYSTPEGWPPPSRVVLYGPDPYYPIKLTPEEEAAWRPKKNFLRHVAGLLAAPFVVVEVFFGEHAIWADDAITLANRLQHAVAHVFVPLQ